MKKLLMILVMTVMLAACGTAYNAQLKQVQLGMTQEQIVALMGDKYTSSQSNGNESLEYVDKYKYHWIFEFQNDKLVKWYKETE